MFITARLYEAMGLETLEVTQWKDSPGSGDPGKFLGRATGNAMCQHVSCALISMSVGLYDLATRLQEGETDTGHI